MPKVDGEVLPVTIDTTLGSPVDDNYGFRYLVGIAMIALISPVRRGARFDRVEKVESVS